MSDPSKRLDPITGQSTQAQPIEELRRETAIQVMGWTKNSWGDWSRGGRVNDDTGEFEEGQGPLKERGWHPDANIAQALEVIKAMNERHHIYMIVGIHGNGNHNIQDGKRIEWCDWDDLPGAICRMALNQLKAKQENTV